MLAQRIDPDDKHVSLSKIATSETGPYTGKEDPAVADNLSHYLETLSELQQRLLAAQADAVLVVLQAMDAAGKDGVLRKVIGPLDSRGVYVLSFKAPGGDELVHDYLWRIHQKVPRKGELTFFNRSHYEEVLVARVMKLVPEERWKRRFEHINAWEKMLVDEGTTIVKIFLHISKEEQKERLQQRLDDPSKNWKFDPRDLEARARWEEYREAYEEVLEKTSTGHAPWYVVPADKKWYRDLAMAELMVKTLEKVNPKYPKPGFDVEKMVSK